MGNNESKVIGFIAQIKGSNNLLCDGDSAVVAGSGNKMEEYFVSLMGQKKDAYEIKKARYGLILQCLHMGAAYSFDEKSYNRFYLLAKQEGNKVVEFNDVESITPDKTGVHLMRVQWKASDLL